MKHAIMRHAVPAFLAIILFMVTLPFYESAGRLWLHHKNAIEWESVKVLTPEVTPGGTLELVYRAKINKQCPSDLRGFLVESDGSVPVRFPVIAGGYRPPSDEFVDVKVKLQIPLTSDPGLAPLRAGNYIYRAIATRYCTDGVEQDRTIPSAVFTLRQNMSEQRNQAVPNEIVSMAP